MIPKHLQGKSAIQIIDEINKKFFGEITRTKYVSAQLQADYIRNLEYWLGLAVKDALCNADELKDTGEYDDYTIKGEEAEGRAIAFLNFVLPYKEK